MKLYWLDLETTGLDPQRCQILEIALVAAELETPLLIGPIYRRIVAWDHEPSFETPFVREMHTKNGLLADCLGTSQSAHPDRMHLSRIRRELAQMIPLVEKRDDMHVLAGSSVHFDRSFLDVHLPEIACCFSHRVYDVSAVKLFCQSLGMPKLPRAEAHRAADDIRESMEHAKQCAAWIAKKANHGRGIGEG